LADRHQEGPYRKISTLSILVTDGDHEQIDRQTDKQSKCKYKVNK